MKIEEFGKKYAMSLVSIGIALIVLWWVLNFIHTKFGTNVVGQTAGTIGSLASGQKYQFAG